MVLRTAFLPLILLATPVLAAEPAPVSALVAKVDIAFEQFTLPNGLRVVVHTDRKAPVVAVSVWYHIGSKDEPAGKTGFAHLFEHLMFGGSENVTNFDEQVIALGGANNNGTTWFDRTNYFETVPTAALEPMLFIEADRMGHLLGAVDQAKLDAQRGVVQNEKRQGDNQPFGLTGYVLQNTLFPDGHGYAHETIGSMADLNAASLTTVKDWFRAHYGPNNSVLVLAGDIDVARARPLVEKYFGDIARGPDVVRRSFAVPTLPAAKTTVLNDRVPYTRLTRNWAVEGVNGRDTVALEVAASVLGGLSSSRLDNALVRGDASAVSVSADVQAFEQVGILSVEVNVKPGQDAAAVGRKLDALIADFLRTGPTADEVARVAARTIAGRIAGYEAVGGFGGKAVALAEGLVYSGDPAKYRRTLQDYAAMTPARVTEAARRWMSRPVFALNVEPGARDMSPAMQAITGDVPGPQPVAAPAAPQPAAPQPAAPKVARTQPPVGQFAGLTFPKIERAKLANGIPVYFARRTNIPAVSVAVTFDAGSAADPKDMPGLQTLTMSLLDEGTRTLNSTQIAEAQERLGATVSSGGGVDRSSVSLYALSANLAPSLDLLADVVRNPAFAPAEVERLRAQQLAGIAAQLSQPAGIANLILPAKLYGATHPYGRPASGTVASVRTITRDAILRFHHDWIWPGNAAIYVVGDTTLAEVTALLETRFGNWPADRMARPRKETGIVPARAPTRIFLADRPQSPQSYILVGQTLGATGKDDAILVPLRQANDVLGGSFLSRLNMDLRETKAWSYGVRAGVTGLEGPVSYIVTAPVQSDKTGPAVRAVLDQIGGFLGPKGVTGAELARTTEGSIRELPGSFETSGSVLGAMQRIVQLGRPDTYYETLATRYRAMTAADLDRAARAAIDPAKLAIVVVGDAGVVRPQLDALGLPVETVQLPPAR